MLTPKQAMRRLSKRGRDCEEPIVLAGIEYVYYGRGFVTARVGNEIRFGDVQADVWE